MNISEAIREELTDPDDGQMYPPDESQLRELARNHPEKFVKFCKISPRDFARFLTCDFSLGASGEAVRLAADFVRMMQLRAFTGFRTKYVNPVLRKDFSKLEN